jgi:hypothetical protein
VAISIKAFKLISKDSTAMQNPTFFINMALKMIQFYDSRAEKDGISTGKRMSMLRRERSEQSGITSAIHLDSN